MYPVTRTTLSMDQEQLRLHLGICINRLLGSSSTGNESEIPGKGPAICFKKRKTNFSDSGQSLEVLAEGVQRIRAPWCQSPRPVRDRGMRGATGQRPSSFRCCCFWKQCPLAGWLPCPLLLFKTPGSQEQIASTLSALGEINLHL